MEVEMAALGVIGFVAAIALVIAMVAALLFFASDALEHWIDASPGRVPASNMPRDTPDQATEAGTSSLRGRSSRRTD
jgi:hypothetical protein